VEDINTNMRGYISWKRFIWIHCDADALPANEFPLNPLPSLKLVLKQIILVGQI